MTQAVLAPQHAVVADVDHQRVMSLPVSLEPAHDPTHHVVDRAERAELILAKGERLGEGVGRDEVPWRFVGSIALEDCRVRMESGHGGRRVGGRRRRRPVWCERREVQEPGRRSRRSNALRNRRPWLATKSVE